MAKHDELLQELLEMPVGKQPEPRKPRPEELTRCIERNGSNLTVTDVVPAGSADESTGADFLTQEGLNPAEWEATGFRKSQWGDPEKPMESVRFTFKRRETVRTERDERAVEELIELINQHESVKVVRDESGEYGFVLYIADPQYGKGDGDGAAGAVGRTIEAIDEAVLLIAEYRKRFDIGHILVGWLGDHIEGFVSQGGASAWRTKLTLNEQLRLLRRVMLYALIKVAPLAPKVTFLAVPGNHGEPQRFMGSGITRYDDSHDTEALITLSDVAELMPERFGHVTFIVPNTDELIVLAEIAGTWIAHHHGHSWRPEKHWEWWEKQAFNRDSAMHVADALVYGHLHHEVFHTEGKRTTWGLPSLEDESTWFRHATGKGGAPSACVSIVKGGRFRVRETIYL